MSIKDKKFLRLFPSDFECNDSRRKFLLYEDRIEIRNLDNNYLFFSMNSQDINNLTPDFLKLNVSEFYYFITSEVEKRNYESQRWDKGYNFKSLLIMDKRKCQKKLNYL